MKRHAKVQTLDLSGYLTSTQAASRCHLLRGSIHYAVKRGRLKAIKLADLTLLRADEVDAWNHERLYRLKTREQIAELKRSLKEKKK